MSDPRRVTFQVFGLPRPKGSARGFVAMKDGKARAIVVADNDRRLKTWEGSVRAAAQAVAGSIFFTEAVRLQIEFAFPRPKSVPATKRPHMTTIPDLSKLIRSAEDALTGVLFQDDRQVVAIIATKRYVTDGPGGAVVTIDEVSAERTQTCLPVRTSRFEWPESSPN